MYIPPSFRVEDSATLLDFVDRYSFAALVSTVGGVPFATHLPLLLDRENHRLLGHVARANPHHDSFTGRGVALAIFGGPHAYISPSWYVSSPAVPTWNYAAVHVYGTPAVLSADRTREVVDRTVQKYESSRPTPWANTMPEDFRERLLSAVVGFELPIARIEGKFKLGQNRPEADQAGVLAALEAGDAESRRLAEFISERRRAGNPS